MRAIIELMSEIEKEARAIVDSAAEKKVRMYEEFDNKVAEIDEKYKKKLRDEVEKLNNKCRYSYEKELQKVKADTDVSIEELDKVYTVKHNKYVDEMFNRIIGM